MAGFRVTFSYRYCSDRYCSNFKFCQSSFSSSMILLQWKIKKYQWRRKTFLLVCFAVLYQVAIEGKRTKLRRKKILLLESDHVADLQNFSIEGGATVLHPCDTCYQPYIGPSQQTLSNMKTFFEIIFSDFRPGLGW